MMEQAITVHLKALIQVNTITLPINQVLLVLLDLKVICLVYKIKRLNGSDLFITVLTDYV